MHDFVRRLLLRKPRRCSAEEILLLATADLRALQSSDQCRDDPALLVAVWSELRLREKNMRNLGEPTIYVVRR
jgi:hypothetical protein